jgi:hypothetical protein
MISLLLAAQLSSVPVPCPTPQPAPINGQPWVCQDGRGWLPPGHPNIRKAPEPPPPPPNPLVVHFRVGVTYRRDATGVLLHMVALGPSKSGIAVLAAECLNESTQDQCWYPGAGRFILANAATSGWTEVP